MVQRESLLHTGQKEQLTQKAKAIMGHDRIPPAISIRERRLRLPTPCFVERSSSRK